MKKFLSMFTVLVTVFIVSGCTLGQQEEGEVVNVYTDRHYDTDQYIYDLFTEETGIKVNIVKAKADELINRLETEGEDTEADVLVVADAGRLVRAKDKNLFQSINSDVLEANVPANLQDTDDHWFGLTMRARVIVYSKDRVNPEVDGLNTYDDLADSKWNDRILVRASSNIYNQSLLASFIAINGEDDAKAWAQGVANNMARDPEGNDRAQAMAIAEGTGDLAIMNTYYIGKMLAREDQKEAAKQVAILFPENTHVNISGAGVTKYASNKDNATKLLEFLSSEQAQNVYAKENYEYPVNQNVEPSALLNSWGDFNTQDINLSQLGEFNTKAVEIFNEVKWDTSGH
ncbi:Fe(3+) ABC transporter substrate-binding protein [Haloplasma contractile]|uniref:Iron uptake protein A1 n=1 Tax=Haloplasma contractile SSD-17B TaxID=1033810 RepID=U2FEP4_9MOLU|nr:Fe(3+) ABC transporter substrate-binding protein [Haloplasma contractile]ERJ11420.1 Iron uptake protein A1 [Haloplasma contractile SSD-17B]